MWRMLKDKFSAQILFLLLMVMVLIKPASIQNINRFIGMAAWGLAFGALVWTALSSGRARELLERYRTEAVLILAFFSLYVLSGAMNFAEYESPLQALFRVGGPLAVMSLLPLMWLIFELKSRDSQNWLVWLTLTVIHLVALVQYWKLELIRPLLEYTVATDAISHLSTDLITTSFFRWHTIYSTIAAFTLIYCFTWLLGDRGNKRVKIAVVSEQVESGKVNVTAPARLVANLTSTSQTRLFYLFLGLGALVGGMFSGSRNYLFTASIGVFVIAVVSARHWIRNLIIGLTILLVALHIFAWKDPHFAADYGAVLPYLKKIERPSEIELRDFLPVFSNNSTSGRLEIWQKGLEMWQEQPWFGIGPGVFGLNWGHGKQYNLHNIILQVLVDTGILGLAVFLTLLLRFFWRARHSPGLPILIAAMGSLMFDNFFDKSMAWVLWVVWLMWASRTLKSQDKTA